MSRGIENFTTLLRAPKSAIRTTIVTISTNAFCVLVSAGRNNNKKLIGIR